MYNKRYYFPKFAECYRIVKTLINCGLIPTIVFSTCLSADIEEGTMKTLNNSYDIQIHQWHWWYYVQSRSVPMPK